MARAHPIVVSLRDIDSRPAQGRLHLVKREHLLGVPGAWLRGDATVPAEECLGEHDAA
jgi:hypothetical protein